MTEILQHNSNGSCNRRFIFMNIHTLQLSHPSTPWLEASFLTDPNESHQVQSVWSECSTASEQTSFPSSGAECVGTLRVSSSKPPALHYIDPHTHERRIPGARWSHPKYPGLQTWPLEISCNTLSHAESSSSLVRHPHCCFWSSAASTCELIACSSFSRHSARSKPSSNCFPFSSKMTHYRKPSQRKD